MTTKIVRPDQKRGYKNQDGCHNCVYCWQPSRVDDGWGRTYYCDKDRERPLEPAAVPSAPIKTLTKRIVTARAAWDRWQQTHDVCPEGRCRSWKTSRWPGVRLVWTDEKQPKRVRPLKRRKA